MIRRFFGLIGFVALLTGLAGLILDLTIRDSHPGALAFLFYLLPLPVSGAALFAASLLAGGRWRRRIFGLAGLLVLGGWFYGSCGWSFPAEGQWKVITWNLGHPRHPFPPLISLIKAEHPDVVVLVESGDISPAGVLGYEHALPGYHMVAGSKELSCLVRGAILDWSVTGLCNGSDDAHFRVKRGAEQLNFFICDLCASPFLPREPQIDLLAERTRGQPRTVVLGDFNTPLESVHLEPMRRHFEEVMDGPHRGFRETWFYGLPLLSIDQIWLSRDLEAKFAARRLTFSSDHAPVVATFSVRP